MPKVERDCPECGKRFSYYESWPRKFCSNVCKGKANVSNIKRWKPSRFTAQCEQCGKSFETTPATSRGRFCSRRCWGQWLSEHHVGEAHERFGKTYGRPEGLPPVTTKDCERCGETFETKDSHIHRRRFCSKKCYAAHMAETGIHAGPQSGTWLGGYEPYYGPSWRSAQRFVRERDGSCRDCGLTPTEIGRSLDVHHIVPFREFGRARYLEANDPSNLVALCNACHTAREWSTNRHL